MQSDLQLRLGGSRYEVTSFTFAGGELQVAVPELPAVATCDASHAVWVRDGTRWISEASGVSPDGTAIASLNIIVPVSRDSFTWQTTDRAMNERRTSPGPPPVKVMRVKK